MKKCERTISVPESYDTINYGDLFNRGLMQIDFDTETQLLESEQLNERYGISEKLEELGNYIYNLVSECVNDSFQQHYYDKNDTYISKMPTIEKQQVFSNIKKENNFTSYYYSYILPNVVNKPSWLSDNTFINISCNVYNDETIWKNDKSINKRGSISSYFAKDNLHLKKLMNNKKNRFKSYKFCSKYFAK